MINELSLVSSKARRLLRELSFAAFFTLDQLGVHVLPKHYYTPVPDYSWLRRNRDIWQRRTDLTGLQWDLDEQLDWLRKICEPYYHEVEGGDHCREAFSSGLGQGYGVLEAQVLHCFIRTLRPANIVEIGGGTSTAIMLRAANLNGREERTKQKITSIEPFPKPAFLNFKEEIDHIQEMCQTLPWDVFDHLQEGDLLFVDSSHAVKTGSDVLHIYLHIIPRLRPGVVVHIHDIFLPYLYHRTVLSDYFGWQETALVLALLMNNRHLSVLCCQSALHYDRPKEMGKILRDYRPQANYEGLAGSDRAENHFPSSLWIRTT